MGGQRGRGPSGGGPPDLEAGAGETEEGREGNQEESGCLRWVESVGVCREGEASWAEETLGSGWGHCGWKPHPLWDKGCDSRLHNSQSLPQGVGKGLCCYTLAHPTAAKLGGRILAVERLALL